ncbi:redoxin domain-containing protein [Flavobacteriaceae bacterium R33]|uniref:Redoxin domain-containing protein n=1 Tax=Poritiphilus flavus TaxID=2697053 RepID=A0A6L9EBV7_9FLAO|nr:redoxin domain-containing protein [Poritiphilus flavus]
MKKKTLLNILLIAFVLSFFVTPLGHQGKLFLNRLFSFSPPVIAQAEREQITDYNWTLKDPEWNFFNFERSRGKVVFMNFWASWRLPSEAELKSVQALYDRYGDKVDFYIITDEERPPVEEFLAKNGFTFPVTYLIIGERAPVVTEEPPRSYIIDKDGYVVVSKDGIADWDNSKVYALFDELLGE